ncbi:hypothetical protein SGFS_062350 [Streptomyces graminofaciens]|uniref:Integrin-like protein n=1 Tax=Streptomyces graminofaciens TaxID=68212 RepID=A0ABN5VP87_9ACTN|nr:FG-GAP and VCBS repeat-containing protein [Streptomyces graminofaciens]BBC34941.1 hypothetical protein SGFS_062350 [Streptomyces graminofaciens]
MRKRLLATAVAATMAAAGLALPLAGPASAAPATADDFNGDGYKDLVVATPRATVKGLKEAGQVTVLYGSKSGVSTSRSATITQNTAGVPGAAEAWDGFGASYTTGDLDGDGYTDLAVGVPSERSTASRDIGIVQILWGGSKGLVNGALTVYGPPEGTHGAYRFGSGLAVGDFDGDGKDQLVVTGYAGGQVFADGFTRSKVPARTSLSMGPDDAYHGTGMVMAGDFDGDGDDDLTVAGTNDIDDDEYSGIWLGYYTASAKGLKLTENPSTVASNARYLRAADDIDKDGYADLITYNTVSSGAGAITVHYGAPGGIPKTSRTQVVDQDTEGVPGTNESGDSFGTAVSVGDVDGDGYADVAVGAPSQDVGTLAGAGSIWLLKGSSSGLTTTGAQSFTQDTTGVPGAAEANDWWGSALRLQDLNADNRADLTIAASGEDIFDNGVTERDGADWILRGSASGLTTTGAVSFNEKAFGLTYRSKSFGSVLGG